MDLNTQFNIAHLEPMTHIYGPGARFTLWLQGCSIGCRGCWNQAMWSKQPQYLLERDSLLEQIITSRNIEGVTLLGGEPLQQAENTLWLLKELREHTDLNIMLYTGYEIGELKAMGMWKLLEKSVDLFIVGRYDQTKRNVYLQWRGSENQQLIYPSSSRLQSSDQNVNEMEVIISELGSVTVIGYPDSSSPQSHLQG